MKLITVALLFLLTIPRLADAQAQVEVTKEGDAPFQAIIFDCVDGELWKPLLEPVALTGISNTRFQRIENKNSTAVFVHTTLKGTAVGLVTKTEYRFGEQFSIRSIFEGDDRAGPRIEPRSWSTTYSLKIPGLYRVHSLVRQEFDKDFQLKLNLTDFRINCPTIDFP